MKYKLTHLSKYCCKPSTEAEFEYVKEAAEQGGVEPYGSGTFKQFNIGDRYSVYHGKIFLNAKGNVFGLTEIPVIDFIRKLRMTEEEAREIEDDRVEFILFKGYLDFSDDSKTLIALNGHHFRVSEDGKTVTLHKGDKQH